MTRRRLVIIVVVLAVLSALSIQGHRQPRPRPVSVGSPMAGETARDGHRPWVPPAIRRPLRLIGAPTYYVRQVGGNDTTGTGSSVAPWATPGKACQWLSDPAFPSRAATGGTVLIGPGLYQGTSLTGPLPEAGALANVCNVNHFRMTSELPATPAELRLSATQAVLLAWSGGLTDIEVDHLILDGYSHVFACGGCASNSLIILRNGNLNGSYNDAGASAPSDIRIHDNVLRNVRNQGMFTISLVAARIAGLQVVNNLFEDIGDGTHPSGSGVYGPYDQAMYLESTSDSVVRGNRCNRIQAYCVQYQYDGSSGQNLNALVEGNTMTSCGLTNGGGIYASGVTILARNNVIVANGEGIRSSYSATVTLQHNTIANNDVTARPGLTNSKVGYSLEAPGGYTAVVSQNIIQGNPGAAIVVASVSSVSGTRNVVNGATSGTVTLTSTTATAATFNAPSYTLATASSAIGIGAALTPAVPDDITDAARDANPDAGAHEYGAYTVDPLTTQTPPAQPTTAGVVAAAAAGALPAPVVTTPTGTGIVRPVTDEATLTAALGVMNPGDVVQLAAGSTITLTGQMLIARSGTAANPIVITSAPGTAATITGPQYVYIQGDYVTIHGIRLANMALDGAIFVDADNSVGARISNNTLDNVGNGADASTFGMIRVYNSLPGDAYARSGTWRDANLMVDRNTVTNPRNVFVWEAPFVRGGTYIGNTITGPVNLTAGWTENEAIKIGWGFGDECKNTRVAYNTITSWAPSNAPAAMKPYTIGIKASCVTVDHNFLDRGRLQTRHGANNTYTGNVIQDGSILCSGPGGTISRNWVQITDTSYDGLGPLVLEIQGTTGGYDGTGGTPLFRTACTGQSIADNVFISKTADLASAAEQGLNTPVWSSPAAGNTFTGNTWYRPTGAANWFGSYGGTPPASDHIVTVNTWSATNQHYWAAAGTSPPGPAPGCQRVEAENMTPIGANPVITSGTESGGAYVSFGTGALDFTVTAAAAGARTITLRYIATGGATGDYYGPDWPNVPAAPYTLPAAADWATTPITRPFIVGANVMSLSWASGTTLLDYADICQVNASPRPNRPGRPNRGRGLPL